MFLDDTFDFGSNFKSQDIIRNRLDVGAIGGDPSHWDLLSIRIPFEIGRVVARDEADVRRLTENK